MVRLAIDVMGGDHGVAPLVLGATRALNQYPQLKLTLVGNVDDMASYLDRDKYRDRLELVEASLSIDMHDKPLEALRNKSNASMAIAIDLVSKGNVEGAVSAGNTGALVAFSVQKLGMLEDVSRPAICTQVPTASGRTWLLDLGATLSSTEDRLVELARLGVEQCRAYDGIIKPRVALLNVGSEVAKGTKELQNAATRMTEDTEYEYAGYVEGNSVFLDDMDVVVCDGFSGNVAIKTAQGVAQLIVAKVSKLSGAGLLSRLSLMFAAPALKRVGRQLDPSLYNGAPLLGLQGLVVKSHGNTDEEGFANAIAVAMKMAAHSASAISH